MLCNLPYVAERRRASLAPEISRHEPPGALFAGSDGLAVIRALLGAGPRARDGLACWRSRSGAEQAAAVGELMRAGRLRARSGASATSRGSSAWWLAHARRARSARDERADARLRGRGTPGRLPRGGWRGGLPNRHRLRAGLRPPHEAAVERLYRLKGRPRDRPAAVMFFSLQRRSTRSPSSPRASGRAAGAAPGTVSRCCCQTARGASSSRAALIPTRSGCACRGLSGALAALGELEVRCCSPAPTSPAGPTRGVSTTSRARCATGADLVLDGGELPGVASTVVDLRDYERAGRWQRAARRRAAHRGRETGAGRSIRGRLSRSCRRCREGCSC